MITQKQLDDFLFIKEQQRCMNNLHCEECLLNDSKRGICLRVYADNLQQVFQIINNMILLGYDIADIQGKMEEMKESGRDSDE